MNLFFSPHPLPHYRPCVGMMILNNKNQIFLAKRKDQENRPDDEPVWQMPQGGIDRGEEPHLAVLREMEEEIGTQAVLYLEEEASWLSYDFPKDIQEGIWKGKYKGQTMRWYAFRFQEAQPPINLKTQHEEFCKWEWTNPEKIVSRVVGFKKNLYEHLMQTLYARVQER